MFPDQYSKATNIVQSGFTISAEEMIDLHAMSMWRFLAPDLPHQ